MKTDDQVIDKLLRRHAAQRAAAPPESSLGAHLDADELGAFAENVLPAATRARYVAHLADCANCRTIVSGIARGREEPVDETSRQLIAPPVQVESGWRHFLNSFFSIPTLRYALPVLAFLVVGGIVWRAYETPRVDISVSDRKSQTPVTNNSSAPNLNASGEELTAQTTQATKPSPPAASSPKDKAKPLADAASAEIALKPPVPALVSAPSAPQATLNEAQSNYSQQPQTENLDQQVFQRKAKDEEQNDELKSATREQAGERSPPVPESVAVAENQAPKEKRREALAPLAPQPMPRRAARQTESGGQSTKDAAELQGASASRSETRSVAGRSFRRQNGAWIDTTYQASQTVIDVARGAEQYRALVADEPSLRLIAEQLSGEVIVVWKNRAYRFR